MIDVNQIISDKLVHLNGGTPYELTHRTEQGTFRISIRKVNKKKATLEKVYANGKITYRKLKPNQQ